MIAALQKTTNALSITLSGLFTDNEVLVPVTFTKGKLPYSSGVSVVRRGDRKRLIMLWSADYELADNTDRTSTMDINETAATDNILVLGMIYSYLLLIGKKGLILVISMGINPKATSETFLGVLTL